MARNQCDGCRRGLPIVNGSHKGKTPWDGMGCSADRYVEEKEEKEEDGS